MGEDFLMPDSKKRVVEEVLAQIAPVFETILVQEIDRAKLSQIIKRNEIRSAAQLTDTLVSKMLEEYNGGSSFDFIGPVGRPGTSSAATDCMDVVPYDVHQIGSSKTEDEDLSTALSNSVLDQHQIAPSTSDKAFEKNNEEEKIRDLNKTTGLTNQGNTCWFNALTQMLFSIPKFRSILYHAPPCTWQQTPITNVQPEYSIHAELLLQFRRLFAEMHFSEESYIPVGDLLTTVDRLYTAKGGRSTINLQQDASEMLTLIVDWLGTAINAAIFAHLNPDYSNAAIEDANMVVSHSSGLPPNSDVAGTAPPGYEEKVSGLPPTSSVQRDPESRANSPVRTTGPARDAYGGPKAKSPRQSPPALEAIDEAMDTSEPDAKPAAFVAPTAPEVQGEVFPRQEPMVEERPEAMNDLVESLRKDTAAIFESTLYTEKYGDVLDGIVQGEANNQVDCPVCFPLPVSYGNLHDGLESFTYGTRSENGVTVNTRAMYNELPAVFFVSLNRFHATALSGHKLHDRFTFPREVYMDRYLRKNVDLIMQLRRKQLGCRDELAQLRAKIAGLKRYPTTNGTETLDLIEAMRTVISATRNVPVSNAEDLNAPDKPPNFVKTLYKEVPRFSSQDIERLTDVSIGLRNTLSHLVEYEKHLNLEMDRLKWEIENIYEVQELKNEMYELKAVIIHSGEMNRGHYWTYKLKRSIDGLEEWEKLNDSNTENVDYSRIEQEAFGTGSSDAPSAYLLLYVKKDAAWLTCADNETRVESLGNLPSDLQVHIDEKSKEWRRRLADFREGKTSTILKPQALYPSAQTFVSNEWPLTFAWYRTESDVMADENANPDLKACLGSRLDSYAVPQSDSLEKSNMNSLIQSLWTLSLSFDRDTYSSPSDLLDWHLRGTIEGPRGGKEFLEKQIGMPIKDLRVDAENDIEQAYNLFIMEYIKAMSIRETDLRSRFVVFVATQLPRIHIPVIRYLLVRSMAVSKLSVLKHRAQEELAGYNNLSADKGATMERIAETLAHIFHISVIAAANCRLCLENVKFCLDNDYMSHSSSKDSKELAERIYIAMVAARNARQTMQHLKIRAGFLEQPSIYFATQSTLDKCTILSMLVATKMVLKLMVSSYDDFSSFGVNLSTNEQTLTADTFIGEICIVLSLIRRWKSGIDRSDDREIDELNGFHGALQSKFEIFMAAERLSAEKVMYATQMYTALTDDQSTFIDSVASDMRLPVHPGSGAEEWEKRSQLEKLTRQLDPVKVKVDALLKSFDDIVSKLWS